jgi:hypothetical protein
MYVTVSGENLTPIGEYSGPWQFFKYYSHDHVGYKGLTLWTTMRSTKDLD